MTGRRCDRAQPSSRCLVSGEYPGNNSPGFSAGSAAGAGAELDCDARLLESGALDLRLGFGQLIGCARRKNPCLTPFTTSTRFAICQPLLRNENRRAEYCKLIRASTGAGVHSGYDAWSTCRIRLSALGCRFILPATPMRSAGRRSSRHAVRSIGGSAAHRIRRWSAKMRTAGRPRLEIARVHSNKTLTTAARELY